jgi:micrococcal nuclease
MNLGHKYVYDIELVSIYDGDTIRVNVDLGFGHFWKGEDGKGLKLRLYGINAPEVKGKEKIQGLKAKEALEKLLTGSKLILQSHYDKTGKYGRYLATIYVTTVYEDGSGTELLNVNKWLVENGFAEYKEY